MTQFLYILLGLAAGIFGGMFGVGGGIILVPALVYIFGLTQHQAQGTTLALMLPPIGLLAALRYNANGNVKWNIAWLVCLGFLIGGYIGADWVQKLSEPMIKRVFGVFLFFVSIYMITGK